MVDKWKPHNHLLSRARSVRDNGVADDIRWLLGALRRTIARIKLTSAVKAFGFSALAAYPLPRSAKKFRWISDCL